MLIIRGNDPDDPGYPSQSEVMFAVACELVRGGCTDDQIASVLLDTDFRVSGHIYRQGKPQAYAARQIRRAHDSVGTDFRRKGDSIDARDQHNIKLALLKLGITLTPLPLLRRRGAPRGNNSPFLFPFFPA
jgi:hypothetical protein